MKIKKGTPTATSWLKIWMLAEDIHFLECTIYVAFSMFSTSNLQSKVAK